jgi:poly-gamma-glutamate capsule biosynthesis protein CapA/YwtB (metallophosphatase superfamily)
MSDASTLAIILAGDVMTGRGIDQILAHPGNPELHEDFTKSARDYVALAEHVSGPIRRGVGPDYIWGDALAALRDDESDLTLVNLETAVTTSPGFAPKGINYRMNPQNVACLSAARIDCCALANNHVLDWGIQGLRDTLATLDDAQLAHAGAGLDASGADAACVLEVPGKARVRVYSFALPSSGVSDDWAAGPDRPGVALLPDLSIGTLNAMAERIQAQKAPGEFVVVSLHWGPNWGYDIDKNQVAFAHGLIDRAGVDLVHGHSSHHPKAGEVHLGRPILYGCGDFLNDYEGITGYDAYRPNLVVLYRLTFEVRDHRLRSLELLPLRLMKFRLNRASDEERAWVLQRMNREYSKFGASVEVSSGDWLHVALPDPTAPDPRDLAFR